MLEKKTVCLANSNLNTYSDTRGAENIRKCYHMSSYETYGGSHTRRFINIEGVTRDAPISYIKHQCFLFVFIIILTRLIICYM